MAECGLRMIECNRATMWAQRSRPVFELVSMKEGKMRTIGANSFNLHNLSNLRQVINICF